MEHVVSPFRSMYGSGNFHCFSFGPHEEDNILAIEAGDYKATNLVRVQSACYTAEIFRSTDCDCHEQLDESLKQIFLSGGLLIYMLCDGRGAGLLPKVRALKMWEEKKIDTYDAYVSMNLDVDPRTYGNLSSVFSHFEITKVRLLTNNPRKVSELEKLGLSVERVGIEVACHSDASPYLETKRVKFGHFLTPKS